MESPDSQEQSENVQPTEVSPKGKGIDPEEARRIAYEAALEEFRKLNSKGVTLSVGEIRGNVNFGKVEYSSTNYVRQIFIDSVRKRDEFMSTFLNQALRQAGTAFNLSVYFMILGGLVVLVAAVLAISGFAGSPSHGIALISGVGGVLIGTSGAAFSRRADKARKHLAEQASMMQSQLLNEQKFSQVIDLLTGIRDDRLNDQARMTLATRLMDELNESPKVGLKDALPEPGKRRRGL